MSQGPNFLVAFREASWNFPRQDRDFKEFRGFPGMELGIFRVAKSSGEGRVRGSLGLVLLPIYIGFGFGFDVGCQSHSTISSSCWNCGHPQDAGHVAGRITRR